MYDRVCKFLIDNGAQLVYTANNSVGAALNRLKDVLPYFDYEVSVNEKVAFELAFTGSIAAKRTGCILSTDGLYKALDPLMSSAYIGVKGGFVILCLKETEEEITPIGYFSKLPLILAEDASSLIRSISFAYHISEKYEIPVLIQADLNERDLFHAPFLDICDTDKKRCSEKTGVMYRKTEFIKNPARWAATPKFRYALHKELNKKIEKIREEFESYEGNELIMHGKRGVITNRREYVEFYLEDTSILYITTLFPLPLTLVKRFIEDMDDIFLIEGLYPAIELQIIEKTKVKAEHPLALPKKEKPLETMYGFTVVRDTLGPSSSINIAHGIKKTEPERKVLAITFESHFFHSGMPAFINTMYNDSSYVLLIMTNEKEEEIKAIMEGYGFRNMSHIDEVHEIEKFKDTEALTVLFCKGII